MSKFSKEDMKRGIFAALYLLVFALWGLHQFHARAQLQEPTGDEAKAYARSIVTNALKIPIAATVPNTHVTRTSDNEWTVAGTADSHNSSGAVKRNSWQIRFRSINRKLEPIYFSLNGHTMIDEDGIRKPE